MVGRKEAVPVYEPMMQAVYERRKPILEAFDKGLQRYYAGDFAEAERIFASIEKNNATAAAYRERSQDLIANPPVHWHGVRVMTSK